MRYLKRLILSFLCAAFLAGPSISAGEEEPLFPTPENKEKFAAEISGIIEKAWKKWQDSVVINGVVVEGSRGILQPGNIGDPVFTSAGVMEFFERKGKTQEEIYCVKAVADALENGMRLWQRGYAQTNIPFPQGASCAYTMPPSNNVPVVVASGRSSGDRAMTEEVLYNFMLYRAPGKNKEVLIVLRASAKGISVCFERWKDSCSIVGILASGGIAPQPAPMGTGPGPVRGAKGNGGKLIGPYFDGGMMREIMVKYFSS
jgi:hypothetical protein